MTRTLRRLAIFPALALMTALGTACDDGINDVDRGLVGSFEATEAVFTDASDPNTQLDVMAEGGTMTMDFNPDGTFSSNIAIPGRNEVVTTGTFTTQGPDVLLTSGNITRTAQFSLEGDVLDLSGPSVSNIDFNDGRGLIPANFNASLRAR